jgi:hypothetical protein
MVAFFAIQIVIDLCHSLTAFPFVHYGMFSESFSAPKGLRYEIVVDNRRLDAADFGIYRWDMIQQPLSAFDRQSETADFEFDRSRFRATFPGIYSRLSGNLENASTVGAAFPDWYLGYLSRLLHQPIHSLQVRRVRFSILGTRFFGSEIPWINR